MKDLDLSDDLIIQQALATRSYAKALEQCQLVLKVSPAPNIYYWAGIAAYHLEQLKLAHHYFSQTLLLDNTYQDAYFKWVLTCLKLNKVHFALRILQIYLKTFDTNKISTQQAFFDFLNYQVMGLKMYTQVRIQLLEGLLQEHPLVWYLSLFLGSLNHENGHLDRAQAFYEKALALSNNLWIKLLIATLLPPIYQSKVEIDIWRHRLQKNIQDFQEQLTEEAIQHLQQEYFRILPDHFYLAYQGLNDKELNMQFMQLYSQIWQIKNPPLKIRTHAKLRLGFLSSFFYSHSVTYSFFALFQAACESEDFEVYALSYPLSKEDAWTQKYKELCHNFISLPTTLKQAAQTIRDQELDILIFMDIGMRSQTDHLALFRMAPIQCVLGGHPVTTGSPEMDYYISTDILEGPDAQEHYSEILYLTQGTPIATYSQEHAVKIDTLKTRQELGLPEGTLYFCPMSLFKIHPDFDIVVAEILKQDTTATILFPRPFDSFIHHQLKYRFQRQLGKEAERISFLPWLHQILFYQVLSIVDVVLDSFPFGGGNTTCISLLLGQPIVTLTGEFLRGRVATAYYTMMGLEHLANTSIEAYIQMALKIGQDLSYRQELQAVIKSHNHLLLNNYQGIQQLLEQFKNWGIQTRKTT